jgi:ATP-binding cassette, subfamily C (CFTR/MRP), member 1
MASSPSQCTAVLDSAFGPNVDACRRAFDFTLLFEESFMSIVPSILLLGFAPIRILLLNGRRRKFGGSSFQILKLVSWGWQCFEIGLNQLTL